MATDLLRGSTTHLTVIHPGDHDTIVGWYIDPAFKYTLSRGPVQIEPPHSLRAWLEEKPDHRDPTVPYAIRRNADDALLGIIAFKDVHPHEGNALFWVGLGNPAHRGHGYGTDAVRVLLRYGFEQLNLHRVGLEVGAFNPAARRSYEKVGFVLEGTIRDFQYRDGRHWDMHLMGILRDEWQARYGAHAAADPAEASA